jgi:hypothetical protein
MEPVDVDTLHRGPRMNTELLCRLPLEQARCRELVRQFQAMGSIGHFAAALVEAALRRADRAIIDGDEAAVREALTDLEGFGRRAPGMGPAGGAGSGGAGSGGAEVPEAAAESAGARPAAPAAARRAGPSTPQQWPGPSLRGASARGLGAPEPDAFTARWPSAAVRSVPAVGRRPARSVLAA